MLTAVAKYIYLSITYDTKKNYSKWQLKIIIKKRLTIPFSSFAILCYLSFSAFPAAGSDGKVARIRRITNTKLHVYKTSALSRKASSVL